MLAARAFQWDWRVAETRYTRNSFVTTSSEEGVPSQVEDQESDFKKDHSAVGVAELSNDNKHVRESGYGVAMNILLGDGWNPEVYAG